MLRVRQEGRAGAARARPALGGHGAEGRERVAAARHDATAWYDYALFLMRTNDAPMAEECSREAIALTPGSGECLLAHGAILASRGNLECPLRSCSPNSSP